MGPGPGRALGPGPLRARLDLQFCKDCPYGEAGKRGFHKNMKIIWKKHDQEYAKNMT